VGVALIMAGIVMLGHVLGHVAKTIATGGM